MTVPARLYAITPDWPRRPLLVAVEQALAAGVRWLQWRDKTSLGAQRHDTAAEVLALCRRYRAQCWLNDDLDLAIELQADGVHLGREDGDWAQARARLLPQQGLGLSAYNQPDLAQHAALQGASYVGLGAVYRSSTKPDAHSLDLGTLQRLCSSLSLPVVAIGGISAATAADVLAQGAAAVAVCAALFSGDDIAANARQLLEQTS